VPTAGEISTLDGKFEFDVDPAYNNQSMTVATSWAVPSDYDLFVERKTTAGKWVAVGSSTNGINTGETATVAGFFPGRYRARVNNFSAAPQQINGTITFSTAPGFMPPQYPSTRTAAQASTYYAKLNDYATRGGNLVLTDGAARALAHLGVGEPKDVKPVVVYAPYIEFNDGTAPTYSDPLASNVNQPGAAEGPSNRHQTVEPVPLGYAIQDADGNSAATSFTWAIRRVAWTAAGGRIAGTIADEVALGEITRGKGRIRLAGALLPDPEVRFDHPFGLANYALSYSGWQVFENLVQWHRPLPDLTLSSTDITFSRQPIVTGDQVTITATVRNTGTDQADGVAVRFTDNGTQIGTDQVIASIGAGATGTASVTWNTRGIRGDRTIAVSADPLRLIRESSETNNSASRLATVLRNNVQNGDFQDTAPVSPAPAGAAPAAAAPASWQPAGTTAYPQSPDGNRSASASPGGSWTSDPVTVTPGAAYGLTVDTTGGGAVSVEQLSSLGLVLSTLNNLTGSFTVGAGVTQIRVKLAGGLTGIATFDNVRMWDQ
jgi:hypothetical protein